MPTETNINVKIQATENSESFEYLHANSENDFKTLVDWFFSGKLEVKKTIAHVEHFISVEWVAVDSITRGRLYRRKTPEEQKNIYLMTSDEVKEAQNQKALLVDRLDGRGWMDDYQGAGRWRHHQNMLKGYRFKLKPGHTLQTTKRTKLVPRTASDFWPLIGTHWALFPSGDVRMITDTHWTPGLQEQCQIAPLGSKNWAPMMKEEATP